MRAPRQLLRAIDANVNRALEGLRVCEDVVRFCFGSDRHTRALRALRHAVSQQARRLPVSPTELLQTRDSRRDPGRRAKASAVRSLEQLLLINLQRAKEALRVLEECSRILAPGQARRFQQLRFRTYDAERSLLLDLATLRHRG